MPHSKGFSLVELMIVVAIIALLASLAIPAYQDYVARSQVAEAISLAASKKSTVLDTWSTTGRCPQSGSDGIPDANATRGKYTASVGLGTGASNCEITAVLATSAAPPLQGKTVTVGISRIGSGIESSVEWTCTSTIEQRYLPKGCTAGS